MEGEKQSRQQTTAANADYLPEGVMTAYYSAGDVDLGTLSELTQSVPGKAPLDGDGGRSKRRCVRVREEISRLEEILGDSASPGEGKQAKLVFFV